MLSLPLAASSAGLIAVEIDRAFSPAASCSLSHARAVRRCAPFPFKNYALTAGKPGQSGGQPALLPDHAFCFNFAGSPAQSGGVDDTKKQPCGWWLHRGRRIWFIQHSLLFLYQARLSFPVPPLFLPRPAVSSAVISLKPRKALPKGLPSRFVPK